LSYIGKQIIRKADNREEKNQVACNLKKIFFPNVFLVLVSQYEPLYQFILFLEVILGTDQVFVNYKNISFDKPCLPAGMPGCYLPRYWRGTGRTKTASVDHINFTL
jgi:hypothetical protein